MSDRVIFHIDVNSAYLSWEAVDRLENGETTDLRLIPSAVGGDIATRHGVILAKSVPAKKYRITTGEPVVDALRKCPELVLVKPRHGLYHEKSKAFINILRQYSDTIEQFSVDEAFVDMTGTRRLFGEPKDAADRIRNQVRDELGFTVNVGVSSNKLLAKMASDFEKPDKTHTLLPEEVPYKMWPLPIGDLFFAGKSTVKKLNSLGIFTIGDLAKTDKYVIVQAMKKHGEVLWRYANGLDDSPVEPVRPDNKGYGNSTTISFDVTDAAAAKGILLKLTDKVCQRLRNDRVKADTVTVQRHRTSADFLQQQISQKKYMIQYAVCLMRNGMVRLQGSSACRPRWHSRTEAGSWSCLIRRITKNWSVSIRRWTPSRADMEPGQSGERR